MRPLLGRRLTVEHLRNLEHRSHPPHPHRDPEAESLPPHLVVLLLLRHHHRQDQMDLRRLQDSKLDLLHRRRAEQHHPRHPTEWLLHHRLKTESIP